MPSEYQRKLTKADAPMCRYCGLRLPKRLHDRGVCDFCHEAKLDDPVAFWRDDPERDLLTDARTYEEHGPHQPEPLPRLDTDTLAVERERESFRARHRPPGLLRGRLIDRAASARNSE